MSEWLKKYPAGSLVSKAYNFAKNAHKDTKRLSGDPFIIHCLAVAETINSWNLDEASIAAALLHDVVEDTHYDISKIEKEFGGEVSFLVDGLTKLDKIQYPEINPQIENLRKFILSFSRDLRVVLIKLADRRHNMQTLSHLPKEKQKRIAWETAEIYGPLAYRLGMQKLSGELEDLAFPYLYPKEYAWLIKDVKEKFEERDFYAKKIKPIVQKNLNEHGIFPIAIDSRAKRYSSLYKKLLRYDMNLEAIHDLVAIRIILKDVGECYAALGIIHKLWSPMPGKIKDYIARPKPNGYRSIHTTVFCVDNKITEFQIRTKKMHEENEFGIAAHWAYQQIKSSKTRHQNWRGVENRQELLWVEQLREWQKNFGDQEEFMNALKIDFFKDRIFVITPHNDVIDLPVGATPIDFAYRIHTKIGDECVGAKVNGRIVPLEYMLHSRDVVEILTQKGKKPSEDWLQFVKTSGASDHIKQSLRKRNNNLRKKIETKILEFKIINADRHGYLKDITVVFASSKINIVGLTSQIDKRKTFSTVIVKCEELDRAQIAKILVKLKAIKGTKEVNYKFNR